MKPSTKNILMAASALWILGATAAWGYGGTIGPAEYAGVPKQATDYKNPLPVVGNPHHYHVTICNDGNWYGVWYPAEWRGNDGPVRGTPDGYNLHGYAKEEDGTGGGVQIMGNGKGGDIREVTLAKKNGQTVYLKIRVIDCSHQQAPRGLLAAADEGRLPKSSFPMPKTLVSPSEFGAVLPPAENSHYAPSRLPAVGYRASPQVIERPTPLPATPQISASSQKPNFLSSRGCIGTTCASNLDTTIESRLKELR
jgi:hypothetical protein